MLVARRHRNSERSVAWQKPLLVMAVGVAMCVAVAPSPSVKRLAIVSPPSVLLLAWLLDQGRKRSSIAKIALGGAAITLAIVMSIRIQIKMARMLGCSVGPDRIPRPCSLRGMSLVYGVHSPGPVFCRPVTAVLRLPHAEPSTNRGVSCFGIYSAATGDRTDRCTSKPSRATYSHTSVERFLTCNRFPR